MILVIEECRINYEMGNHIDAETKSIIISFTAITDRTEGDCSLITSKTRPLLF